MRGKPVVESWTRASKKGGRGLERTKRQLWIGKPHDQQYNGTPKLNGPRLNSFHAYLSFFSFRFVPLTNHYFDVALI